ncbi:MAG TPA: COX15/CtaA family protein [Solirubrobacteraceae bacterium]|jgi:cytochrome c oxidase assembly protein subunit 15|nr:COX15/CtaA family protein [Solirubrobacteraceae bacterium]
MRRLDVDEERFRKITYVALAALSVIVLTGALVRLTDSGLGCPTWPRCYGHVYPPVALHPLIEFGNRAISGFVGVITAGVFVAALRRKPFRKDLVWLSAALPAGVIAQAVLGGFTVREQLAPGFVMSHFLLSMVILIFAFWLAWRATYPRGARPRTADRVLAWSVRALAVLCGITLLAGTAATAAGPHSGGNVGQHIKRLTIEGPDTLQWAVHQHATIAAIFGVATILVWLLKRKRTSGALDPLEPLTVLAILLAAQGLVGSVQYELKLPAEMVWVHVGLATATWLVSLLAVAVEGRIGDPEVVENEEAIATIVAEWSRSVPAS